MSDVEFLNALVAEGEGQRIEFKQSYSTDLDKEIVAFANSEGGSIFIALKRLTSYVARPALSNDRLTEDGKGELLYELKRAWKNCVNAVRLAPVELIERLCALVPPVYLNLY